MNATAPASPISAARQHWFIAALLLIFVAASVQYSVKAVHKDTGSAIQRWREQVLALAYGENIYDKFVYPNPPIMALILRPIYALPPVLDALLWYYLKVAMTLAAMNWAFRLVETTGEPFPAWAKAVTVLLALRPILGDLAHGNVNLFILFLVVGALYAFREGRDFTCGVVLGLAIACKVTPALFLPYFVWKRAWKTLAGCTVGLVLFFGLVPSLCLGFAENYTLLTSWWHQMVTPYVLEGKVDYSDHNNQSIPGVVLRLATHSPSFRIWEDNDWKPIYYHNLLSLDARYAAWIVKGCMALFAGLIVWSCNTPTAQRQSWRLAAEFSLVLIGMLLFSERTWKHHCVTLLLPFAVLLYYLATCRPSVAMRNYLVGTLAAVTLLMTTTSTGPDGDNLGQLAIGKLAQVYGAYVWAYILLIAALVRLLRTHEATVQSNEACPSNAILSGSPRFAGFLRCHRG